MAGLAKLVARGRAIPWLAVYEAGKRIYRQGRRAWDKLGPADRRRLGDLLRKSHGRRSNLSDREYDDLKSLIKKAVTG